MNNKAVSTASLLTIFTGALLMSAPVEAAPPPSGAVRTLKTIYSFTGSPRPNSLLSGSDGNLYGTTERGGAAGYGTLYRADPLGNFVTLHEFGGDSGAYPFLVARAADGRLYGGSKGVDNRGIVYRIEPNGEFQLLHEFTGAEDMWVPVALVAASDGNIYGFSRDESGRGSFFRVTPGGTFEVVRQFNEIDTVFYPFGLVEENGVLYGYGASAAGIYTLFRITPQGAVAILHIFPSGGGTFGTEPNSLVAGADGNIYGTTPGYYWEYHGLVIINNPGSMFQCTPTGEFSELHLFPPGSLYYPPPLVQSNNRDLYFFAGPLLDRLTLAGEVDPLYWEDSIVYASLTLGVDEKMYGTSWAGGNFGAGALFKVVFGQPSTVNLSSRLNIGTGDDVPIGGFIVTGDAAKKVMVRAIGPSLAVQGVSGVLQDPLLELHDASGAVIAGNNDWRTTLIGGVIGGDQSDEIQASGIAPTDDHEAAMIVTLQPGNYTAVASGNGGGTGIGVVEMYDLEVEASAQLANISTRGFVDTGNNVMIGGLIVDGSSWAQANVVFRAIGPSLSQTGISNSLQDPALVIYNSDGTPFAANDDWRDGQQPELIALGLAPEDDRESAIYVSLTGGNGFTAIVSGHGGTTGVALVEIYNVP